MRLSVALCTFNGGRFLPDQLASLARQTRLPDELMVCDDGSSDDTVEVVRRFAATAHFPVHVHENPTTLGPTKNFERAFGLCTGDVISPCDQDDVWLPEKLTRLEAVFAEHPSIGLVFSDAWLADSNLVRTGRRAWQDLPFTPAMRRIFDAGDGPRVLLRYNVATGAAMAFRSNLRDIILPIPAAWHHDAWTAFVASAVAEVRTVPEPLIVYRQHADQQVGISRRTIRRQLQAAFIRLDRAYFIHLAERFDALAERLDGFRTRLRDPAVLDFVREKVAMARTQADMRDARRGRRVSAAVGYLVAGRYHRYGHGLRSFAVDVLGR